MLTHHHQHKPPSPATPRRRENPSNRATFTVDYTMHYIETGV